MAKEQTCNNGVGVLSAGIDASATSLVLTSLSGLPAAAPFNIRIDGEILRVTAINTGTKTYTVTRAAEGTTATIHATSATVFHPLTLAGFKRWNEQLLNGTAVAHQRGLNFIPGAGVAITLVEDAANENCDVTIAVGDLGDQVILTGSTETETETVLSRPAGKLFAWMAEGTDAVYRGYIELLACDVTGIDKVGIHVESDLNQAITTVKGPAIFQAKATLPARDGPITTASDGATITFDLAVSDRHQVVLRGPARNLALTNYTTGQEFTVLLGQDDTGSRTVQWWLGISWPGGTEPTLSTGANKVDMFTFLHLGANLYLGRVAGQNY